MLFTHLWPEITKNDRGSNQNGLLKADCRACLSQSIQSTRLSFQSSESGPLTPSPARECCSSPLWVQGGTLACGGFNIRMLHGLHFLFSSNLNSQIKQNKAGQPLIGQLASSDTQSFHLHWHQRQNSQTSFQQKTRVFCFMVFTYFLLVDFLRKPDFIPVYL